MSNNNNKGAKGKKSNAQARKALKNEILAEIRAAAGMPAKGKGRGKRNRQAKQQFKNPGPGSNSGSSGVSATYNLPKSLRTGSIQQNGFDATHIKKCEFVQNVTGTTAFTLIAAFAINPGLAATFPWLSTIAQSWEKFRFRKLVFHYITRTGNNVPGTVLFAPDYDASDAQPATEQIASDYMDADECPPYANPQTGHYVFPVNVGRMNDVVKEHYIRTGALAANQDIKLYDPANVFFFSVDGTAVSWGKLWVEYEVDLFIPQLPPTGVDTSGIVTNVAGTGVTTAAPFGTATTISGSLISGVAARVVSLQNLVVGRVYQLIYSAVAAGGIAVNTDWSLPTGCTVSTQMTPNAGSATDQTLMGVTIVATASTATITVNPTITGAATNMMLSATPLPVGAI